MNVFVSHAALNDPFVAELRIKLNPYGVDSWTDSHRLTAGDTLEPVIRKATEEADENTIGSLEQERKLFGQDSQVSNVSKEAAQQASKEPAQQEPGRNHVFVSHTTADDPFIA